MLAGTEFAVREFLQQPERLPAVQALHDAQLLPCLKHRYDLRNAKDTPWYLVGGFPVARKNAPPSMPARLFIRAHTLRLFRRAFKTVDG
jgi:hypothetical protein